MNSKNTKIKENEKKMNNNSLFLREIQRFQNIIKDTIIHINNTKTHNVINGNEFNQCINSIDNISRKLCHLKTQLLNSTTGYNDPMDILQSINNDLSLLFRSYGTNKMRDLLLVCLGSIYVSNIETSKNKAITDKWQQIVDCVHPISYKVQNWKGDKSTNVNSKTTTISNDAGNELNLIRKTRIVDDNMLVENGKTLEAVDLARISKDFYQRVYGIKVIFQDEEHRKTLIVNGIVDDIPIWVYDAEMLSNIEISISNYLGQSNADLEPLSGFVSCLTLKDTLIYSYEELAQRFIGYVSQANRLHKIPIANAVTEFMNCEQFTQRNMLLQLLIMNHKPEYQYLAYLLFDILSADTGNSVDTNEQTILFESLPSKAKQFFKEALKRTIQYTQDLNSFETNKIPLEQQICLMKATDAVKERAMQKLKEVKNKNEDSGTKARQYLEALLRIPFGIYRQEPILSVMDKNRNIFTELISRISTSPMKNMIEDIPVKQQYTGLEVTKYTKKVCETFNNQYLIKAVELFDDYIKQNSTRDELVSIIHTMNTFCKMNVANYRKIPSSGKSISQMLELIASFVDTYKDNQTVIIGLINYIGLSKDITGHSLFDNVNSDINTIEKNQTEIKTYINFINETLTNAVHGHNKAKRQIERIIGQWINGEQTGYCFGFEGAAGIGKTSLAKKGIAKCLVDNDGTPRPFTFIAIGGASNGSTLEGHNYTYVASTWGRIVDVLMEKKCMNPIIFVDELDKVSRTEHGREIIGILTHLIDPTQNDTFQDKYFNGIDLDLSKALFIFSYNDVDLIDRILLDRIHRIKFDALTLDDKLIIAKDYLMPEVLNKMGLVDVVDIPEETMTFIIDKYTNEPGVRKLREILFEIVGEINISVLKGEECQTLPVVVTIDDVKQKYLHERDMIRPYKITRELSTIGIINGLYANSLGQGGVLPIEVSFLPSSQLLDLHLTGMQGDVMKESMQVARTLAFELAGPKLNECLKEVEGQNYKYGLHIHVPEGATKKDGPSAGTAITIAIYSRLTKLPIKHNVAITGEICLSGRVTAIGGLQEKVLGGIKAGVKHFIFPKENEREYNKIVKTYGNKQILDGITFTSVDTIYEALEIAIDNNNNKNDNSLLVV